MNHPCVYMCPTILNPSFYLPPHPIPLGYPRAPALRALIHKLNLHWLSILHMVIYMFQCYSLKSSYPYLLPQSPKVCSLHLCLFCCLAYRVIVTGSEGKVSASNAGDPDSTPGSGSSPGRRKWLSTPVFLPGEFHGQRSLAGYSPRVILAQIRLETYKEWCLQ